MSGLEWHTLQACECDEIAAACYAVGDFDNGWYFHLLARTRWQIVRELEG